MNPLHGVVLVLLCVIILLNLRIPPPIRSFGVVPVTIVLLFIVLYLFTQSPLLGVVGLITAYSLMQTNTTRVIPSLPPQNDVNHTNFQETLEEYMVKRIVPLVQSPTPTHLNFKYAQEDTHNASSLH
jgi:hypothetical protein